jgi:hypothetical protein
MRSLERAPPKYIVTMTNMAKFPELQDYVGENYHPETNTELEKLKEIFPFEIYRRKGV